MKLFVSKKKYDLLNKEYLLLNDNYEELKSAYKEKNDRVLDLEYKNSKERKDKYYVQQTRERTLITSLGLITFNKTYYKSKNKIDGKYEYYSYLETS